MFDPAGREEAQPELALADERAKGFSVRRRRFRAKDPVQVAGHARAQLRREHGDPERHLLRQRLGTHLYQVIAGRAAD
ncbi:MAG: hypothetical protein JOY71_05520 [Acetobacteraceae bacterium]|nr:hypothetical protein [Acetobacteraceae bacterium]MBV8521578.1 hypothetical protein [Acetobacteraceae bacterium]MBV8588484.1 hypothetical protein [Acetobacteraceae bacterium]